jgi:hypothetical protein
MNYSNGCAISCFRIISLTSTCELLLAAMVDDPLAQAQQPVDTVDVDSNNYKQTPRSEYDDSDGYEAPQPLMVEEREETVHEESTVEQNDSSSKTVVTKTTTTKTVKYSNEEAAVKVQSAYRGHHLRKHKLPAITREKQEYKQVRAQKLMELEGREAREQEATRHERRQAEQHDAAQRMQATFRGYNTRKNKLPAIKAEQDAERARLAAMSEEDRQNEETRLEEERQARLKAKAERKAAKGKAREQQEDASEALKEAPEEVPAEEQPLFAPEEEEELQDVAVFMQGRFRKKQENAARKKEQEAEQQRKLAEEEKQRAEEEEQRRQEEEAQAQDVADEAKTEEQPLFAPEEEEELQDVAVFMQGRFRKKQENAARKKEQEAERQRKLAEEERVQKRNRAATKIQARQRGIAARNEKTLEKKREQRMERHQMKEEKGRHKEEALERQSVVEEAEPQDGPSDSTAEEQPLFAPEEEEELQDVAVFMQGRFRKKQENAARKKEQEAEQQRKLAEKRHQEEEERVRRENQAATKIQARQRGIVARNENKLRKKREKDEADRLQKLRALQMEHEEKERRFQEMKRLEEEENARRALMSSLSPETSPEVEEEPSPARIISEEEWACARRVASQSVDACLRKAKKRIEDAANPKITPKKPTSVHISQEQQIQIDAARRRREAAERVVQVNNVLRGVADDSTLPEDLKKELHVAKEAKKAVKRYARDRYLKKQREAKVAAERRTLLERDFKKSEMERQAKIQMQQLQAEREASERRMRAEKAAMDRARKLKAVWEQEEENRARRAHKLIAEHAQFDEKIEQFQDEYAVRRSIAENSPPSQAMELDVAVSPSSSWYDMKSSAYQGYEHEIIYSPEPEHAAYPEVHPAQIPTKRRQEYGDLVRKYYKPEVDPRLAERSYVRDSSGSNEPSWRAKGGQHKPNLHISTKHQGPVYDEPY